MSVKYLLLTRDRVVGWTHQQRGSAGIHVEYGLRDGQGVLHTSGIARLERVNRYAKAHVEELKYWDS
ncbi:MAG: hypothetical protein ACT4QB_23835 [Gammaproteobacteria bacterium]